MTLESRSKLTEKDLEKLQSTGKSMMPDGLESGLSQQQMADLLSYVSAAGTQ